MHDQAAIHFGQDLQRRADARRTRSPAPNATSPTKEALILRERGQFDRRFEWIVVLEFHAGGLVGVLHEHEWFLPAAILEILHPLLAHFPIRAK